MKVLAIPDVHLKDLCGPAADILEKIGNWRSMLPENERQPLGVVFLGDLADDWGQEKNLKLYEETFDQVIGFVKEYQEKYEIYYCLGNHDISYVWGKYESGYSVTAQDLVCRKLKELRDAFTDKSRFAFIHNIDNCMFSHAGLSWSFVQKYADYSAVDRTEMIDDLIRRINERTNDIDPEKYRQNRSEKLSIKRTIGAADLWDDDSPIWVRMQKLSALYFGDIRPYHDGRLQVVGHTPVESPLYEEEKGLLTLDTFSTYRDGSPIGDGRFVVIDTIDKTFQYADEMII